MTQLGGIEILEDGDAPQQTQPQIEIIEDGDSTPATPPPVDISRSDLASQNPIVNAGMSAASIFEKPYKAFERGLALIAGPGAQAVGLPHLDPQNQLVQSGLNPRTNYPHDPNTMSGAVGAGAANIGLGLAGAPGLVAMGIGAGEEKAEEGGSPVNVLATGALNFALGKLMPGQKLNKQILAATPVLRNALVNAAKNILISAGVGVGEAEAANMINNLIDKHTGLDPNRELFAGAEQAAIQGAVMGGGGQLVHEGIGAVRGRGGRGPTPQPQPTGELPLAPVGEPPITHQPAWDKGRPQVPPEIAAGTNAEIVAWAAENGFDTQGLENLGRRPLISALDSQRMAQKLPESTAIARESSSLPPQLPPEATSWDAGALGRFAKRNGYAVDQTRFQSDVDQGMKPRDAVRKQIEEQYGQQKGVGPTQGLEQPNDVAARVLGRNREADTSAIPLTDTYRLAGETTEYQPPAPAPEPTRFKKPVSAPVEIPQTSETPEHTRYPRLPGETDAQWNERRALTISQLTEKQQLEEMGTKTPDYPGGAPPEPPSGSPLAKHVDETLGLTQKEEHPAVTKIENAITADEQPILTTQKELSGLRTKLKAGALAGEEKLAAEKRVDTLAADVQNKVQKFSEAHGDDAGESLLERLMKDESGGSTAEVKILSKIGSLFRKKTPIGTGAQYENAIGKKPVVTEEQAPAVAGRVARQSVRANPIPGTVPHESRVPKSIEELVTPINSRVRDISPAVYGDMMKTLEKEPMQATAKQKNRMLPVLRELDKAIGPEGSEKANAIKVAWLNNDIEGLKRLLPPETHAAVDTVRSIMDELHTTQKQAGVDVGHLPDYLPRGVKDYEGLLKTMDVETKGRIEAAWDQQRKAKGAPLTDAEKQDITNSVIQGYGPRKPGQGGPAFTKTRKLAAITPEQAAMYENPLHTALSYIDRANRVAAKAKFLGKGSDPNNLMQSVGNKVSAEIEAGRIPREKQDELTGLLHTRLLADNIHMGGLGRLVKDSIYVTTITHLWNGLNQLTDFATIARRHGLKAAYGSAKDALHITPRETRLVANEMGIDHKTGEFRDPGKLDGLLHYGTKLNAFQKFDMLTKEAELNAAVRNVAGLAKVPESLKFKRLQRDWEPVLGKEKFAEAVNAAKNGDVQNEALKDLAFMKLTEVQPITQSNMPEKYLKMKDGRIFYTLHTFALQQLDSIRRDTFRKMATSGQRGEGLKNLAALITLGTAAGMTKDAVKDLLQGKDLSVTPANLRVGEAMLGIVGLNRYMAGKGIEAPFQTLIDTVAPPVSQFDAPFKDIASAGDNKGLESVKLLPVPYINDMLYYHTPLGRGNTRTYEQGLQKLHNDAIAAYADGDMAGARSYVQLHNAFEKDAPAGITKRKTPLTVKDLKSIQRERAKKAAG